MNQEVEQQNLEASRVTPEEIAELFCEPDAGPTTLLDKVICALALTCSALLVVLFSCGLYE